MKLKTKDLKYLFLKYFHNFNKVSGQECPTPEKIIEAIKFPSKKTRKVIDHILECDRCFNIFRFFRDLIKLEDDFINSLHSIKSHDESNKKQKKGNLNIRFLKIAPYTAIIISLCVCLWISIRYVYSPKKSALRSSMPEAYLSLVFDESLSENCPFFLKWDQIEEAKSYLVRIFDSSLMLVWSTITQELQIRLPSHICRMINIENQLLINFEAEDSEGNIIFSWLGKFPDIKTISGQKVSRIRLR